MYDRRRFYQTAIRPFRPNSTIACGGLDSRQKRARERVAARLREAAPNDQGEIAIEGRAPGGRGYPQRIAAERGIFQRVGPRAFTQVTASTVYLCTAEKLCSCPTTFLPARSPVKLRRAVAALVRDEARPKIEEVLAAKPALLVITAGLQDPGNLGTIARSAEAFGVTGLLLGEKTVSPWNWKAVRASAGSLFRLPTVKVELAKALPQIKAGGVRVLATSSHRGISISDADLSEPLAFVVGSEGAGVPKNVLAQADEVVMIPQSSRVESLNAGIATSIMLYEAARQRK